MYLRPIPTSAKRASRASIPNVKLAARGVIPRNTKNLGLETSSNSNQAKDDGAEFDRAPVRGSYGFALVRSGQVTQTPSRLAQHAELRVRSSPGKKPSKFPQSPQYYRLGDPRLRLTGQSGAVIRRRTKRQLDNLPCTCSCCCPAYAHADTMSQPERPPKVHRPQTEVDSRL